MTKKFHYDADREQQCRSLRYKFRPDDGKQRRASPKKHAFRYTERKCCAPADSTPAPADAIMQRLMNDITIAKRTEREAWIALAYYLATGQEKRLARPRIRIKIEEQQHGR